MNYSFIEELFRSILQGSKTMEGRMIIAPRFGIEINSDDLHQVIKDQLERVPKKYPMALLMPPPGRPGQKGGMIYRIIMFFLKTTYYDPSEVQDVFLNLNTQTSTHTVQSDWDEMSIAANAFSDTLEKVARRHQLSKPEFSFHILPNQTFVTPVSFMGNDRLSGVRLEFPLWLSAPCVEVQEYEDDFVTEFQVPEAQMHDHG